MMEQAGNQTQPPNSPEWENKEGIQGWKFRVTPLELPDSEAVAWELPSAGAKPQIKTHRHRQAMGLGEAPRTQLSCSNDQKSN